MLDAWCCVCKGGKEVALVDWDGYNVCGECGLTLDSPSINENSERRTFANESGDKDPNGTNAGFLSSSLGSWKNRGSNPDRGPIVAFKTIAALSDRLGLVATIKDRAYEIFRRVEDQKFRRGRDQDALLAACLYVACQLEDKPSTLKEICSAANGATKMEIGRAIKYIMKWMELQNGQSVDIGPAYAADYMRHFGANVGMNNDAVKAAQEVAQKAEEFDIRRSPISIAAAVIYIITQLSNVKTLRDISVATGVSEGTIWNSYKDLRPHISKIIPSWFVKVEDLKTLCSSLHESGS